jgi:antitoxin component YwqK of YwqJK toxin-antitoxin module
MRVLIRPWLHLFSSWEIRSVGIILTALLGMGSCSSEKVNRADSLPLQEAPEGTLEEIYWRNGQLLQRGYVVDGKYEGVVELWWENGTRHSRKKFRHSVLIDTMLSWNGDGQLSSMIILEDGNPVSDQSWNDKGALTFQSIRVKDSTYRELRWDENGQLIDDRLKIYPKKMLKQFPAKNGDRG